MTVPRFSQPAFTRNPIAQAEIAYQQRTGRARRWWRWLARGVTLLAVAAGLILYASEIAGVLLQRVPLIGTERLEIGGVLLLIFTTALHFMLMFRTLALTANSITREAQGNTWELLVLTGLDARQIVLGKWWATVRRMWRLYAVLALLRACVAVWFTAFSARLSTMIAVSGTGFVIGGPDNPLPTALHLLAAGLIVAALTMANLIFTAACGVLASSEARSGAWALARALGSRVVLLVAASSVLLVLTIMLWNSPLTLLAELITRVASALLDNGLALASELVAYRSIYYFGTDTSLYVVASGVLSVGAYGLLAWSLLVAAQRRLIGRQALPPVERRRENGKR